MSTLKTHNLQSADSGSVNIALTANAGMIVTGISTFNNRIDIGSLGVTTNFTVAGISTFSGQLNVGSNIKLGTAGVVTATSFVGSGANLTGIDATAIKFGGAVKAQANAAGVVVTGILTATSFSGSGSGLTNIPDSAISALTASKLTGALPAISGANLTNLPPSAPVGGATTNQVFFENDKLVEVNYQITSTKNAMTAGPVSVSAGIAVTVPSGCSWTIV